MSTGISLTHIYAHIPGTLKTCLPQMVLLSVTPGLVHYALRGGVDVREAATYNQFRLKCKAQMLTTRRHQKFRRLGDRRSNILSTRLRLDWSQLNSTLVKFNLTPRSCSCGAKSESVAHYLLHCPLHKDARQTLATAVRSVVDQSLSTNMLLNGLPVLAQEDSYIFFLGIFRAGELAARYDDIFGATADPSRGNEEEILLALGEIHKCCADKDTSSVMHLESLGVSGL
ncbi:hypothetical protein Bbelb_354810 [Branchiostoma belcheri]|nr:hypothetical protein Bbelb_354810 [Branchiostoma belcheri]